MHVELRTSKNYSLTPSGSHGDKDYKKEKFLVKIVKWMLEVVNGLVGPCEQKLEEQGFSWRAVLLAGTIGNAMGFTLSWEDVGKF